LGSWRFLSERWMDDILSEAAVARHLNTGWLGRPAHVVARLGSTNTTLREMAEEGAPAGTLLITDFQEAGKGRFDRRWEAPAGTSLLFSLLFRPGWPAQRALWLTMCAGLAAAEAVEAETGQRAGLKWPNDAMLVARGGWRKMGGLLLETEVEDDLVRLAVLGIGLNVNIAPDHLPAAGATSLLAASGEATSRLRLLGTLLQRLESHYEAADRGESPQPAWNRRLITLEHRVRVSGGPESVEGTAEGTDAWGRLLVRDDAGRVHAISAGDVTLREEGGRA